MEHNGQYDAPALLNPHFSSNAVNQAALDKNKKVSLQHPASQPSEEWLDEVIKATKQAEAEYERAMKLSSIVHG